MKFINILLFSVFLFVAIITMNSYSFGSHSDPLYGIKIRAINLSVPYERRLYAYGEDSDHDGQNTRAEILIRKSLSPVTFTNDKKRTVKSGRWFDSYTGVTFKSAKDVDIDHLVPLYEVHISGGYAWSAEKKQSYANDLGPQSPLRITHRWTNRIPKNTDDPSRYSPSYVPGRCAYLQDWIDIKRKWNLSMDAAEADAIRKQFSACH
ncbi:MAG: hypothetical protein R3D86_00500 [Emcibacteraceae bacterium]